MHSTGHTAPVTTIQVPPGAPNRLLTGATDGKACLWDLRYPSGPSATMQARSAGLLSMAVRFDGVMLAAGDKDCRVHVWDLRKVGLAQHCYNYLPCTVTVKSISFGCDSVDISVT